MEHTNDVIIIGGGLSSAVFANSLARQDKKVVVIEAREDVGGSLCSLHEDAKFIEIGAHTCYRSYTEFIKLLEVNLLQNEIQEKVNLPLVFNQDGKNQGMFKVFKKVALALNLLTKFTAHRTGKTVQEYFSGLMGKYNYEKIGHYMFRAVLCQKPDDFPSELVLKSRKVKKNKMYPSKYYFRYGMQSIVDKLLKHQNIQIMTNSTIKDIDYQPGDNTVIAKLANDFTVSAKSICIATDVANAKNIASNMLGDKEPEIANFMDKLDFAKCKTIVYRTEKATIEPFSYTITDDEQIFSIVSTDARQFTQQSKYRFFATHTTLNSDEEHIHEKVSQILGTTKEDVVKVKEHIHILPTLTIDDVEHVKNLDSTLNQKRNLYIVGNYFYGMSIEDCVQRAIIESDRFIKMMQ